jgi:hypothetical protein
LREKQECCSRETELLEKGTEDWGSRAAGLWERETGRLELRDWTFGERNRKAVEERLNFLREDRTAWVERLNLENGTCRLRNRDVGISERGTARLEKRDWTFRERNKKAGVERLNFGERNTKTKE